jgi:cell division protein FtsB
LPRSQLSFAHQEQQKKIEAYKQTNKFIESETKSLQGYMMDYLYFIL